MARVSRCPAPTRARCESPVKSDLHSERVAVLMATYNGREYLEEQVESILRQTHRNLRLVALDDCSTDGTYELLCRLGNADERICVLRNSANIGAVRTFERLLGEVSESFFCLADQDDVWCPFKLERQMKTLYESNAALVYSDIEVVDENLKLLASSMWRYAGTKPVDGTSVLPFIIRNPVSGCTMLGDARHIPRCLPFPAEVAMHDCWLTLCLAHSGGVVFDRTPALKYRQHGNNATGVFERGVVGLAARIRRAGGGLGNYLRYRYSRRIGLARAFHARNPDPLIRSYLGHVDASFARRVRGVPAYAAFLACHARALGYRAIFSEVLMNALPR